jgi:hypothetical protein
MNNTRPRSIARQPLKFPGIVVTAAPAPTLADVMTRLTQLQQNQAQILKAVQALQTNLIRLALMVDNMFEVTNPVAKGGYNMVQNVGEAAIQDMIQNANS